MARGKHQSLKSIPQDKRKPESKEGLKIYLIACEGECTEPNYINGLIKYHKSIKKIAAGTQVILAPHGHSDPHGVLADLLEYPDREQFDEFWIVIDRDEVELKGKGFGGHPEDNFLKTIKESKENGVEVACSNPCFEFWLVLHFEYRDTACSRLDIQKKALEKVNSLLDKKEKLKSIDELKSRKDLFYIIKDNLNTARINAEKLSENEKQKENPSTGMYLLMDSLLGKLEKEEATEKEQKGE